MPYGDFKDFSKGTASDKVLCDKTFNIAKNSKYDGRQRGFASMVYKSFDKMSLGGAVKSRIMSNQELAEELYKQAIAKLESWILHSSSIDNIWGVHLPNMQLICKCNRDIRFLLCVTDISVNMHGLFL